MIKISFLFCVFFSILQTTFSGNIVVIHGISSGGKTSIMHELALNIGVDKVQIVHWDTYMKAIIAEKALELGYDLEQNKYQWWTNFFKVTEHFTAEERRLFSLRIRESFFAMIKQAALHGKLVLVDTIDQRNMSDFLKVMGEIKVTVVLVYTPLHKIIKFIQSRNSLTVDELDKRSLLISLVQYQMNFKPMEDDQNEIVLDRLNLQDVEKYFAYMNQETYWYMPKPENFEQKFIEHFTLNQISSVNISPVLSYDIVLYQSELPVSERAQVLKNMLKNRL